MPLCTTFRSWRSEFCLRDRESSQPAGTRPGATDASFRTTFARIALSLLVASAAFAATDWPTGNRMTPPTIDAVQPLGVARGATVEMTVEGLNLAKASQV